MLDIRNYIFLALLLSFFLQAEGREWNSNDGKKINGEWVRDVKDAVVIKVKNKEFKIPLERLSQLDRDWLLERRKKEEDAEKLLKSLAGTTQTFAKNDTQSVTFHAYFPKSYNGENPPPMLILFSPGGGGKGILRRFKGACENLGWIGVGCDTFKNGADDKKLGALFEELLPIIEKIILHDPQRLYLGGMSGGASRALHYTAQFDRPWRGVVSCGGWLAKEYDRKYRKKMAVAWVNGDKDQNANGWVEGDSACLKKRRCKTKLSKPPLPNQSQLKARWSPCHTRRRNRSTAASPAPVHRWRGKRWLREARWLARRHSRPL